MTFPIYMMVRKHSPWLREVNAVLGRLRDGGFIWHLMFRPLPLRALPDFQQEQTTASAEKPLTLDRFFVSFMLLLAGLIVSIAVLFFERCIIYMWF